MTKAPVDLSREDDDDPHRVDTVPPPKSGDAYSAATVVRDAPADVLEKAKESGLVSDAPPKAEEAASAEEAAAKEAPVPAAPSRVEDSLGSTQSMLIVVAIGIAVAVAFVAMGR